MKAVGVLSAIKWGAILLGVTTGLLLMALLSLAGFLVLNVAGGGDTAQLGVLAVANFTAQFLAGFVAGKFASESGAFNGSFAGLGFFAISTGLQILDGSRAGALTFLAFGVLSAVIGAAGGFVASRQPG